MRLSILLTWVVAIMQTSAIMAQNGDFDRERRQAYLDTLQGMIWPERPQYGPVSPLDATWADRLVRTGGLPPDFDRMPAIPFLPDPG